MINNAVLDSSTFGEGNAGNINIEISNLSITDGGRISVGTFGEGNSGILTVNADRITISGSSESTSFPSGLFANSTPEALGSAGDITVNSSELRIANNATITVDSDGFGDGGNVILNADNLTLDSNATITASTGVESGAGANADIKIAEQIQLRNNSSIVAQSFGSSGGNVSIDAGFIIVFPSQLPGDGSDIIANSGEGSGGNIDVAVDRVFGISERLATPGNRSNDFDASSSLSIEEGIVVNIFDSATLSPPNPIESEQTTVQACEANRESAAKNNFVIEGKGGIVPEPGEPLNSLNVTVNGEVNPTANVPEPIETAQGKIQPARGIKVTESGEVILTAYRTNNQGDRLLEIKPNCS
ncbi:hypothetical protein [Pleurocapsa sp. PCC 7319]|uniref:hypothetical protein n=1 Tax=Pleurocapsa sp. PCC 7319 TaxID=118161 RepID=UPI0003458FA8|nr:hypothetical protein [Pleurocapsa sp. PCC 7319]